MAVIRIPGLLPDKQTLKANIPISLSQLGTFVFDDIIFKPVKYYPKDATIAVTTPEIIMQSIAIQVTRPKNIVETQVAGLDGSIKQYMSNGDFVVTINAKINERLDVFPYSQMEAINQMCECTEPIDVISKYLNIIHKIDKLVVFDLSTSPEQGSTNEANVTITLKTDNGFDPSKYLIKNESYN